MELKWLRYPEKHAKHVSTLPESITFDLTVRFPISLVLWKLDIQSFPRTPKSAQSKLGETFKYVFKISLEKARNTKVSRGDQRLPKAEGLDFGYEYS